jgi:hypothetical protein
MGRNNPVTWRQVLPLVLLLILLPGAKKRKKQQAPEPAPAKETRPQTPTAAATPPPPPPATAPTSRPVLQGIDGQIELGKQALAAGKVKDAAQAFRNALDFDKNSPMALHGTGLCQIYANDKAKGIATLERAASAADNANRAVVYNLAVANLSDNNPMRAAKFVKDYLSHPGVPLDEPLQNVLGAALAAAGSGARDGQAYKQFRDFYFAYDARLAAARHDGTARWGMRWINQSDAERKWKLSRERSEEYDDASDNAAHAALATKKARGAVDDLNRSFALKSDAEKAAVRRNLKAAVKGENAADKKLERAKKELNATEMPEFPKVFDFIPIDALKPEQNPPQHGAVGRYARRRADPPAGMMGGRCAAASPVTSSRPSRRSRCCCAWRCACCGRGVTEVPSPSGRTKRGAFKSGTEGPRCMVDRSTPGTT